MCTYHGGMQSWIEIDQESLCVNFDTFSTFSGVSKLAPVVKSNAYGHGLEQVFHCLSQKGPQWYCVNYASEARKLRELGFRGKILIVGPCFKDDFEWGFESDAHCFLGSQEQYQVWKQLKNKPKVHIKIDSGMSRQGFREPEWTDIAKQLEPYRDLVYAVCTHFSNVEDVLDQDFALHQLKQVKSAAEIFTKSGFATDCHAASSASSLILPESRMDLCRVGISMYGYWPSSQTRLSYLNIYDKLCELRPSLTWKTKIAIKKTIDEGDYIGYGNSFRANKKMDIAVLPVGYNEGFPRIAGSKQSYVLADGKRCPIVGRICMNMMMVDVTHTEHLKAGDEVVLIGAQGEENITSQQLAEWSETIHYELLTNLNPNIPRVIVESLS